MRVCSEAGLLSIFHELYYNCQKTRKDYKDICYRTNFYLSLIEMDEVNEDFVTRTLDIFDSNYAYPYTLRNRFKVELLEQNQVFSEKFFAKLKEMGKELPESLK